MTTWNTYVRKRKRDVYVLKPAKGHSGKHAMEIGKTSLSVKGMLAEEKGERGGGEAKQRGLLCKV